MIDIGGFIGFPVAPLVINDTTIARHLEGCDVVLEVAPATRTGATAMNKYQRATLRTGSGVIGIVDRQTPGGFKKLSRGRIRWHLNENVLILNAELHGPQIACKSRGVIGHVTARNVNVMPEVL